MNLSIFRCDVARIMPYLYVISDFQDDVGGIGIDFGQLDYLSTLFHYKQEQAIKIRLFNLIKLFTSLLFIIKLSGDHLRKYSFNMK